MNHADEIYSKTRAASLVHLLLHFDQRSSTCRVRYSALLPSFCAVSASNDPLIRTWRLYFQDCWTKSIHKTKNAKRAVT